MRRKTSYDHAWDARGRAIGDNAHEFEAPEPTPAQPHLPADFDTTLFSSDQLEYLEDYYADAVQKLLARAYRFLTGTTGPRVGRAREIGINVIIIAKILQLDRMLSELSWSDLQTYLRCGKGQFFQQRQYIQQHINHQPKNDPETDS